jgi:hypothetical protein
MDNEPERLLFRVKGQFEHLSASLDSRYNFILNSGVLSVGLLVLAGFQNQLKSLNGEYKFIIAGLLIFMCATLWIFILQVDDDIRSIDKRIKEMTKELDIPESEIFLRHKVWQYFPYVYTGFLSCIAIIVIIGIYNNK